MSDQRLDFPATGRNADAILQVLRPYLDGVPRRVLEVASGSGQHGFHFTKSLPELTWCPSDIEPEHLVSIDAWADGRERIEPARHVDVTTIDWWRNLVPIDAIFNANMIHISPWATVEGLFSGANALLDRDGLVFLYGPFKRAGEHTSPSNEAFNESLLGRNPLWGVRDLEQVEAEANKNNLVLDQITQMPANNLTLIFQRT